MSSEAGSRSMRIIHQLGQLVETCRAAEFAPDALAARDGYRWNSEILDNFDALCDEREDLRLLAAMIRASARAELAAELLPGLEGLLGAQFHEEVAASEPDVPPGDGPVLVFDRTQAGGEIPPRLGNRRPGSVRGKSKGKRAAASRPAGDAA